MTTMILDLATRDHRASLKYKVAVATIIEVSRLLTSELQRLPVQHKCR